MSRIHDLEQGTQCGLWNTKCSLDNRALLTAWQGGPSENKYSWHSLSPQVTQHAFSVLDYGSDYESIWSIFVYDFLLEPLTDVQVLRWKLCLQWVNLKFSRRFTNTAGIPLTCIQTRYKGSNMLGTSHSLLGIGSNHYVIREYNAAVSKHLFLAMNF